MISCPVLLVRFDIDKIVGGAYGYESFLALFRCIDPTELEGCMLFDGDSAATLRDGVENVNVVGIAYPEVGRLERFRLLLSRDQELCALLSQVDPFLLEEEGSQEPLCLDGVVRSGLPDRQGTWALAAAQRLLKERREASAREEYAAPAVEKPSPISAPAAFPQGASSAGNGAYPSAAPAVEKPSPISAPAGRRAYPAPEANKEIRILRRRRPWQLAFGLLFTILGGIWVFVITYSLTLSGGMTMFQPFQIFLALGVGLTLLVPGISLLAFRGQNKRRLSLLVQGRLPPMDPASRKKKSLRRFAVSFTLPVLACLIASAVMGYGEICYRRAGRALNAGEELTAAGLYARCSYWRDGGAQCAALTQSLSVNAVSGMGPLLQGTPGTKGIVDNQVYGLADMGLINYADAASALSQVGFVAVVEESEPVFCFQYNDNTSGLRRSATVRFMDPYTGEVLFETEPLLGPEPPEFVTGYKGDTYGDYPQTGIINAIQSFRAEYYGK